MILNPSQASAIAKAMCELNNLGTVYLFAVEYPTYGVRAPVGSPVVIRGGEDSFEIETYADQNEFFAAYNLN